MKVYPWGETKPSQTTYNLPDTGLGGRPEPAVPRAGHPAGAERRDARLRRAGRLVADPVGDRRDRRPPRPAGCGDLPGLRRRHPGPARPLRRHGLRQGSRRWADLPASSVPAGGRTVWFSVAGSDDGVDAARSAQTAALRNPAALLRTKRAERAAVQKHTRVILPGDRLLQRSVIWSKQNLADSVQEARHLQVRVTNAGTAYPAPVGTVSKARWIGAGWPDYPWLFATDGEYTGFAAVASRPVRRDRGPPAGAARREPRRQRHQRQGRPRGHPRRSGLLRRERRRRQHRRDREVPERGRAGVALDRRRRVPRRRSTRFAVSNMRYIFRELDADERRLARGARQRRARPGMGEEKLDNTVYTIRGLRDLADLAASKGDTATRRWATSKAAGLEARFDKTWWFGPAAQQYADSLDDPGNKQVFQRHWIGVTPAEAEITRPGRAGRPARPDSRTRGRWSRSARRPATRAPTGCSTPAPARPRRPAATRAPTCDTATSLGAGRALGVHAEHLDHGGRRGGARPDGRRASCGATPPATRGCSSTRRCGSCPARCRRSRRRPDFGRRTSTSSSPSGRWRCRRGAPTASCGRSCTTSSGSAPTPAGDRFTVVPQVPSRPAQGRRPRHPASGTGRST